MKKIGKKILLVVGLIVIMGLGSACARESGFLTIPEEVITTDENGNATISGETNEKSSVTIDGKTVEVELGSFEYPITLLSTNDKKFIVLIDFNGEEIKKEVWVKPSTSFVESTEKAEVETALALAEKNPNQKNYDEAQTLVASLSKEYADINQRLEVVQAHVPIVSAVEQAEKDLTRDNLVNAQSYIAQATLNKSALEARVQAVEQALVVKEEKAQKLSEATAAVEKAEQSLADEDYTQATTLVSELTSENTELKSRLETVNQGIAAKKAEEQRLAEEAAAQAAAAAQAQAEAAAQAAAEAAQVPNEQIVMITATGKKYHTHKCGNGNFFEATLQEALNRGLTPCSKCY